MSAESWPEPDLLAEESRSRPRGLGPLFLRGSSYLQGILDERQLPHSGVWASHLTLRRRQLSQASVSSLPLPTPSRPPPPLPPPPLPLGIWMGTEAPLWCEPAA